MTAMALYGVAVLASLQIQAAPGGGFAPGGRAIVSLSFAGTAPGALPAGVRVSGYLQVVDKDGVRMLRAASRSELLLQLPEVLPQDFTLEFDLIPKTCCNPEDLAFEGTPTISQSSTSAHVLWHRDHLTVVGGGDTYQAAMRADLRDALPGQLVTVAASFEGNTIKLYTNGLRLFTLTDRRFVRGRVLRVFLGGQDDDQQAVYLARVRIATGPPAPVVAVALPATQTGTITPMVPASGVSAVTTLTQPTATATPISKAPINVRATFTSGTSATVTWDRVTWLTPGTDGLALDVWPENDSCPAISYYQRPTAPCRRIEIKDVGAMTADVAPLDPSKNYYFKVWAWVPTSDLWDREGFPNEVYLARGAIITGAGRVSRSTLSVISGAPAPVVAPITGNPGEATIAWSAPAGAVTYEVWRRFGTTAAELRTPNPIPATSYSDPIADPRLTYEYQIKALQPDGTYGTSAWTGFTPPPMQNPASFGARLSGGSEVTLFWQAVAGVSAYRVDGPGLPVTGESTSGLTLLVAGLPPGTYTWQVATVYPGNLMDMATRPSASATLPTTWRTAPFLMRAGPGSLADQLGYYTEMVPRPSSCTAIYPWECMNAVGMILNFPVENAFRSRLGGNPRSPDGVPVVEAAFADLRDMGAGRHVRCAESKPALAPGVPGVNTMETLCWASTHGPMPGTAGWGDAATTLAAVLSENPNRGWTFLRQGVNGTLFAAFEGLAPPLNAFGELTGYGDEVYGKPKSESVFDVEGPKRVPHSCLACHGGRYDATIRRIVDASLIPLDPSMLVFSGQAGKTRQDQEESIRRINMIVLNASPSPAVAEYIRGLYGGTPDVAGTKANDNYIPAGWTQAPDLYRKVVKPYCQGCHLQQTPRNDFATYQNFLDLKAFIQALTCGQRSMPHAEAPFLAFWRDGNAEALPEYMMAALGLGKCTP